MSVLLVVVLTVQFEVSKYVPWICWLAVVFISVVGTLITDNLTDHMEVPLLASTFVFALALALAACARRHVYYGVGYLPSLLIFAGPIVLVTMARYALRLNAVLAFWVAYVLTRPLGASIGDYLTQDPDDGGLGLGIAPINGVFFALILVLVGYLTWTKRDVADPVVT